MSVTQKELDQFVDGIERIRDAAWSRGYRWGLGSGMGFALIAWGLFR